MSRTPRNSVAQALHCSADLIDRLAARGHTPTPAQIQRHVAFLRLMAEDAKRMETTVDELVAEAMEEEDIRRRRIAQAELARFNTLAADATMVNGQLITIEQLRAARTARSTQLGGAA